MTPRFAAGILAAALMAPLPAAAQANSVGTTVYAQGNCFIFKTASGNTLFERSGGGQPTLNQTVKGELHDFGYQQLYDTNGKELLVGFVQNYGVKKEAAMASFKKTCR